MKKYVAAVFVLVIGFLAGRAAIDWAADNSAAKALVKTLTQTCVSKEIGARFKCDPAWPLAQQGKTMKVTISKDPSVTMVLEESDLKTHFISELTHNAFASLGRYEDGFFVERQERCQREAIKVNGYLKGHPDVRVSDFYLIDHLQMHTVRFTVAPKEAWEDYKWLVKATIDSLEFIRQEPAATFRVDDSGAPCEETL